MAREANTEAGGLRDQLKCLSTDLMSQRKLSFSSVK